MPQVFKEIRTDRHMSTARHLALTVALLLAGNGGHTQAAEIISYSLTFCENLDVLMDPTNVILAENASKATQHTKMMQRTNPYFELRNTSEQAQITQFNLSIGDLTKNFDWAKAIETSAGVSFTVESVDDVMGGIKSDFLTISFSGLAPGGFVRFRFGLSDDDPNAGMIQDYRMILFDLTGADTTDNAEITVDFESGDLTGQLENQLPNFTDFAFDFDERDQWDEDEWERWYELFDRVQPFNFEASGVMPIPEPSTYVMAAMGIVALLLTRRGGAANSP